MIRKIQLTESEFKSVIKESVARCIAEGYMDTPWDGCRTYTFKIKLKVWTTVQDMEKYWGSYPKENVEMLEDDEVSFITVVSSDIELKKYMDVEESAEDVCTEYISEKLNGMGEIFDYEIIDYTYSQY